MSETKWVGREERDQLLIEGWKQQASQGPDLATPNSFLMIGPEQEPIKSEEFGSLSSLNTVKTKKH
jgi:hypothetical protein